MGALSFAADTLASLFAAFASKNPPPGLVNLTRLTLELDEQATLRRARDRRRTRARGSPG